MKTQVEMVEVEMWALVDEDGDYQVAKERDELEVPDALATRWVRVKVKVPKPQPVELEAEVAEEPDAGELVVR